MKKEFAERVVKNGVVDTRKYRYVSKIESEYRDGAWREITMIYRKRPIDLDTTADWEAVAEV